MDFIDELIEEDEFKDIHYIESDSVYHDSYDSYDEFDHMIKRGETDVFNLLPHFDVEDIPNIYKNGGRLSKDIHTKFLIGDSISVADFYTDGKLIVFCPVIDSIDIETNKNLFLKILRYTNNIVKLNTCKTNHDFSLSEIVKNLLYRIYYEFGKSPKDIKKIVESELNDMISGSDMLFSGILMRNNIYRRSLKSLMNSVSHQKTDLINKGVLLGSKLFNALGRAGYIYNVDDKVWEKCVNIIPEYFMQNGEIFHIPTDKRKWTISKLSVSTYQLVIELHIQARCLCKIHPNVSPGGKVCVGRDIHDRFKDIMKRDLPVQEYADIFLAVEKALEIVNFDSSYTKLSDNNMHIRDFKLSDSHNIVTSTILNKSSMRRV